MSTNDPDVDIRKADVDFAVWRANADAFPGLVFTAFPDGSIEFVNKRWREYSGLGQDALLQNAWRSLVHPDDLLTTMSAVQRAAQTGAELGTELRIRRADGRYRWVRVMAAPVRDASGGIVRWFGTTVDVEARRRADFALSQREQLLADSERRFYALAEAIPVLCWSADANGSIDWYNRRWYDYTGQTPEEALGWGWQAVHHPDDFLEVMKRWPHSIATGEPFEMEFRLRRHDGQFHWFLTRAEPQRDRSGAIVRWYGSNVDIDAQKKAHERTKRVAETLQDVFLPKELPQRADLRLDAVYLPAERDALVGGDWFDATELPDGRLLFSIGDVAGHGLQASVIVGRLRQAIVTLAFQLDDPAQVLAETDQILRHQDPETMVTVIVGFLDRTSTQISYANAGHPAPVVAYRSGEPAVTMPDGDPPLGLGPLRSFKTMTIPVRDDMVVALYTDGMIEFSRDVIAAEAKLRTAVTLLVGNTQIARPAMAIRDIVLDDAPTSDDAALLLLQFSRVDLSALRTDPSALERTWRFHSSDAFTAHASRHEIMTYLRRMAEDPDAVFAAELIVGEILANTVEHAPGLVEVHIDWTSDKPVLTIRDTGPGLNALNAALPDDVLDEGGRGLFLIRTLAEKASVRPSPGYGTELRAMLPITRRRS